MIPTIAYKQTRRLILLHVGINDTNMTLILRATGPLSRSAAGCNYAVPFIYLGLSAAAHIQAGLRS